MGKKTKARRRLETPQRGLSQIAQERRLKAWELRKAGMSYRAIARALGISWTSVKRYLDRTYRELDRMQLGLADEQRKTQLARLDDALLRLQPILTSKDRGAVLGATEKLLKIEERRAKLLGLDLPVRQAPEFAEGMDDEEALKQAEAALAAERARIEARKARAQPIPEYPHDEPSTETTPIPKPQG